MQVVSGASLSILSTEGFGLRTAARTADRFAFLCGHAEGCRRLKFLPERRQGSLDCSPFVVTERRDDCREPPHRRAPCRGDRPVTARADRERDYASVSRRYSAAHEFLPHQPPHQPRGRRQRQPEPVGHRRKGGSRMAVDEGQSAELRYRQIAAAVAAHLCTDEPDRSGYCLQDFRRTVGGAAGA